MSTQARMEAMSTPEGFAAEQRQLAYVWHFLALTTDVPEKDDWKRLHLGGREIFIQNTGEEIKGFENRCAHRGYPIRNEDRGNGPILCGFHHWRYDKTGFAYGIPNCESYFGKRPKQLNKRLEPVEIGICGQFVFGRFVAPEPGPDLREWLGDIWPILEESAQFDYAPTPFRRETASHWFLNMEISLDDYHVVAVHPTTFGVNGYLDKDRVEYRQYGPHSSYVLSHSGREGIEMSSVRDFLALSNKGYRIFQVFPNMLFTQLHGITLAGHNYDIHLVQSMEALAHDRTRATTRFALTNPPRTALQKIVEIGVKIGTPVQMRKIHEEDFEACENLQRNAGRLQDGPIAATEERISWFRESYEQYAVGNTVASDVVGPAGLEPATKAL